MAFQLKSCLCSLAPVDLSKGFLHVRHRFNQATSTAQHGIQFFWTSIALDRFSAGYFGITHRLFQFFRYLQQNQLRLLEIIALLERDPAFKYLLTLVPQLTGERAHGLYQLALSLSCACRLYCPWL